MLCSGGGVETGKPDVGWKRRGGNAFRYSDYPLTGTNPLPEHIK